MDGKLSDTDGIRQQIAAIRETLRHIERSMQEAKDHREQSTKAHTAMLERLIRLESGAHYSEDLPRRVAHNEMENAVQDAVRAERQATIQGVRQAVFGGVAAAGTLAGLIALIVTWVVGTS